ncbi:hypothetical protein DFH09DRAFT_37784 [Mycena vulgaris]|nr:hypothetical protein DFH09DRAFT_37784 [Mycena vulgaris]
MSTSQVLILVDDSAMSYVGGGAIWDGSESAHWIDNNSSFVVGAGPPGSFSYTFQGTSIAFYGNTSPPDKAQTMSVRIDGDSEYQSTQPAPQEYRQWYVSPTLSDSTHTIVMDDLVSIDLDYVTVAAGPSTPLRGATLIVDDDDPELIYAGKWATNTNFFTVGHGFPSGLPFQNSTHQSSTVGDSLAFQFAGTSVEVHGVFQWNVTGSIAASFSVDGKPSGLSFVSSTEASFDDQPNFEFFKATGLQPGNHTLVVNVTNVVGAQSLMLDYILYQPSFDTLASKPNFSAASSPASASHSPQSNVKAIAGGVVGGLVLVLLGVAFLLWNRSRRRRAGFEFSSRVDAFDPNRRTNPTGGYENQGATEALMTTYDPLSLSSRHPYIRAEIDRLPAEPVVVENTQLNDLPPPAYDSDHGQTVADYSEGSTAYTPSSTGMTKS